MLLRFSGFLFCLVAFGSVESLSTTSSHVGQEEVEKGIHVHWLRNRGEQVTAKADLAIFCTEGIVPSPQLFWASASLHLSLPGGKFTSFQGSNVSAVTNLYKAERESFAKQALSSILPWRSDTFRFSPFDTSCVGIATPDEMSMTLEFRHVNYYMVITTFLGLGLFYWAPILCRSTAIHYTTVISLGASFSLLLLAFLAQSRVRNNFGLGGLLFAYMGSLYGVTSGWYNLTSLLRDQGHWVLGYVLLSGSTSAALLYRLGPPSHPRTLDLLQWTLQFIGLLLIVLSSHHPLFSTSLALAVLAWNIVPGWVKARASTQVRKNLWRPRVKLLTEEEYREQSNVETRKALEELRRFCQSPSSDPWKMVTKVRNPGRFAEFVDGSPHLTEEEVMSYSTWSSDDEEDRRDQCTEDEESDNALEGSEGL